MNVVDYVKDAVQALKSITKETVVEALFIVSGVSFAVGLASIPVVTVVALARDTPTLSGYKQQVESAVITTNAFTLASLSAFLLTGSISERDSRKRLERRARENKDLEYSVTPTIDQVDAPTIDQVERDLVILIKSNECQGQQRIELLTALNHVLVSKRQTRCCETCRYWSGDSRLRCAVNPVGDPVNCLEWEAER